MALAWRQIYVANRRVRENKKKVSKNKNYYDRSCLAPESMRGQYDDNGVCVVHFLFVCLFILCLCVIAVLIGVRISASASVAGILVTPIHNKRSSSSNNNNNSNEHTTTTAAANA